MIKSFQLFFYALVIVLLCAGCRKDIILPDKDLEKLFGKWEWLESSGGIAGRSMNPSTTGHPRTVEFTKNGLYKVYEKDKLLYKIEYSISVSTPANSLSNKVFLIKYKNASRYQKNTGSMIPQSLRFIATDTLYLVDWCADCFGHSYARKK